MGLTVNPAKKAVSINPAKHGAAETVTVTQPFQQRPGVTPGPVWVWEPGFLTDPLCPCI